MTIRYCLELLSLTASSDDACNTGIRRTCRSRSSTKLATLEQYTFCTRHLSLAANNWSAGHSYRNSKCLERALSSVVVVVSSYAIHMHCNTSTLSERLEAMWQHLTRQVSYFFPLQSEVDYAERAIRQVNHGTREGFIEWTVGVAKTRET